MEMVEATENEMMSTNTIEEDGKFDPNSPDSNGLTDQSSEKEKYGAIEMKMDAPSCKEQLPLQNLELKEDAEPIEMEEPTKIGDKISDTKQEMLQAHERTLNNKEIEIIQHEEENELVTENATENINNEKCGDDLHKKSILEEQDSKPELASVDTQISSKSTNDDGKKENEEENEVKKEVERLLDEVSSFFDDEDESKDDDAQEMHTSKNDILVTEKAKDEMEAMETEKNDTQAMEMEIDKDDNTCDSLSTIERSSVDSLAADDDVSDNSKSSEPPLNYDKGLEALNAISEKSKMADSEDIQGGPLRKRAHSGDADEFKEAKRAKLSAEISEEIDAKFKRREGKIKKVVKRLTKEELEDFVARCYVENLTTRSELGALRQKCDIFEEAAEKWQKKALNLQKQCTDLTSVMRKYINDCKESAVKAIGTNKIIIPAKVTRSVGLQVSNYTAVENKKKPAGPLSVQQRKMQKITIPSSTVPNGHGQPVVHTPVRGIPSKTYGNKNGIGNLTQQTPVRKIVIPKQVATIPTPILPKGTITITSSSKTINPSPAANSTISVPKDSFSKQLPLQAANGSKNTSRNDVITIDSDDEDITPKPPSANTIVTSSPSTQSNVLPRTFILNGNMTNSGTPAARMIVRKGLPSNLVIQRAQPIQHQAIPLATHPAPLPVIRPQPLQSGWKLLPPKPSLKLSKLRTGIVLSWTMEHKLAIHAEVSSYQIFAYQEGTAPPQASLWKKVGDVKALPLPMACTLTQFQTDHKYHFAVRAKDCHERIGMFSDPQTIMLN